MFLFFFFQAEDGIRDIGVTGVQTCALPISYRFREEDAQDEILELLDKFGDQAAESEIIEIKGMILVQSSLDPIAVIDNLKQLVASEPWQVRYVLRVLPVQVVVPTRLDTIKQGARNLVKKMGNDTFRVTVEKRHNNSLGSMQIVKTIADQISNKVDQIGRAHV